MLPGRCRHKVQMPASEADETTLLRAAHGLAAPSLVAHSLAASGEASA